MTKENEQQPIALKEWAVSVKALAEGQQIIIMRKGGIIEETRDFHLISPTFYLMPAFEHQKKHLLKEQYEGALDETLVDWSPNMETIKLEAYAEVVEDIEVTSQETLDRLRELHIWTDTFAEERLNWKRTKPLHVLVLRVFRLSAPIEIPMRAAYNGCKSWVRLEDEFAVPEMASVLEEGKFQIEVQKIKQALA
ncbi:DUF1802 family protein [Paenibacillus sp. Soil522]|uniref:DUF1802 family protein n=1 Tax=Paenibacillus sp. Soil522 TaxID=1736388 RepID=UPI0006FB2926|nr:DUF1802 family protein [Paenibacillus sp. Soil522]KRE46270.1 hypothetical protein ASG81_11735 [Paenibacillus sp. Soil522]